ncbi:MAG: hypothetical protein A2Z16_17260 [Chloroflexi bacterium RBG_16_54_18]|nr:MAG: hypothetical protein A2Z16_17260 [Chloroflexi bacterium RBG_16_54_18]
MAHKKFFRWMWLFCILAIVTMSCSLLGNFVEDQIDKTIETQAEAIITEIDIESIVTEVDLEAIVTEIDIESIVTEINPEELLDTVGTLMPEPENTGERPEGIPVLEPNSDFITSKTHVEYSVEKTPKEMADYYEQQMPSNGWTKVAAESKVETDVTTLVFTKDNRKATITVEEDFLFGGTVVTIDIVQT